ncbi:MAG TPA: 1,4-dihydroxy-6-naphthoate synthase [Chitinophagaceae bacterium]
MKLTLGFSPCPNDTFIFDALVNNKIDSGEFKFDVILEDVETLNQLALKNTLDITKISYGVLPLLLENYVVLNSGSALGSGVGPLLIANEEITSEQIANYTIAIPGENTTAHMLFTIAFPQAKNKIFLRYNEIEDFVLSSKEKNVAGVIIHENRFTYQQKGLIKIIDLGEFWEQKIQSPIPLGGIVAKKNIDISLSKKIDGLIKQSIEYSFSNYPAITDYVRENSQEMEEAVMRKHIDLYVNNYSINLGNKGKNAIKEFLNVYQKINPDNQKTDTPIFIS